jgi:hypothetical protein
MFYRIARQQKLNFRYSDMIRNKTARSLALRWVEHSPRLIKLAEDGEITEETLSAAHEVMEVKLNAHAKSGNKASRIEAHKARLLVDFVARNMHTKVNSQK